MGKMHIRRTMSDFSLDLLHQIEAKSWQKVSVFGYSMGGYLALMMASQKSELFDKIVTLGTKLDWNEEIGKAQSMILNPDVMESKVPKYTAYLDSLHTAFSWREVVHATAKLLVDLGANPPLKPEVLQQVQTSCVLCLGDEDKMVTEAESRMACSNLVDARFRILEHTPHPLEKVNSQVLIDLLLTEFTT